MKNYDYRILKIPYRPDRGFSLDTSIAFDLSGLEGFKLKFVIPVNEFSAGAVQSLVQQKTFFLCVFIRHKSWIRLTYESILKKRKYEKELSEN